MDPKNTCGCGPVKSEMADPYQESLRVVWEDPPSYDPLKHAPPYMPGVKRMASDPKVLARKVASSLVNPKVAQSIVAYEPTYPLATLLAVLRAASFLHQTHHWQTHAGHYYSDHLLFDRLYKESQDFIDQVAERAIGLSQDPTWAVCPTKQADLVSKIMSFMVEGDADPETLVRESLKAESLVLTVINQVHAAMEAQGTLTHGTDNLLQGVADLHETFVYLLQQRAANNQKAYTYGR